MKKVSTAGAKQSRNISQQKLTIGLDLGDRNSWYCVVDEAGQIQLEQAGGPAFDLVDTAKTVGAPLFALFEGRVPRAPTAGDMRLTLTPPASRNEISPHPTFTCTNPASPNRKCR